MNLQSENRAEQPKPTDKNTEGILTEIPLTERKNEFNDCGPLALEMVLNADGKLEEADLEKLREKVGKESDQGTMPGNLVKALVDKGYKVHYYTTINWSKCTNPDDTSGWDERLKPLDSHFAEGGYMPKEKFAAAAQWLTDNPQHVRQLKDNEVLTPQILSEALRMNLRLLVLVSASHWVVMTGIDDKNIYFNDPAEHEDPQKRSMPIAEFQKLWLENLNAPEIIIADPN